MRVVSSKATFGYKWVFPTVWFGLVVIFIGYAAFAGFRSGFTHVLPMLAVAALLGIFGYLVMRWTVFDLVDEVRDDGNTLIVRNGVLEDRIALSDISDVNYSVKINPPRVTLSLRKPTMWGNVITFCAPLRLVPFTRSPVINELIERIGANRSGAVPPGAAASNVT